MTPIRYYLSFIYLFLAPKILLASSRAADSFSYSLQNETDFKTASPAQETVFSILNFLFPVLMIIFVNMIIWGGAKYYTSHINEEGRASAMNFLSSGIVGAIFVLFLMGVSKFLLDSTPALSGGVLTF